MAPKSFFFSLIPNFLFIYFHFFYEVDVNWGVITCFSSIFFCFFIWALIIILLSSSLLEAHLVGRVNIDDIIKTFTNIFLEHGEGKKTVF